MKCRKLAALFFLLIGLVKTEKLTQKENRERLAKCGKVKFPVGNNKLEVNTTIPLVRVAHAGTPANYDSLGTFVSARHLITSAQPLVHVADWKDFDPVKYFKVNQCIKDTSHAEIPDDFLQNLKITSGECGENTCEHKVFTAKKGWLLNICNANDFDRHYVPMILEVTPKNADFACLAYENTDISSGIKVQMYGIEFENVAGGKSWLKLTEESITDPQTGQPMFKVKKYHEIGSRGGPAVNQLDGKETVIGIAASPAYKDSALSTYFFNMKYFAKSVCDLIGVCYEDLSTITIPTEPTTTELITVVVSTETTSKPEVFQSMDDFITDEKLFDQEPRIHPPYLRRELNRAPRRFVFPLILSIAFFLGA